jgi:hypothetical protein
VELKMMGEGESGRGDIRYAVLSRAYKLSVGLCPTTIKNRMFAEKGCFSSLLNLQSDETLP